MIYLWRGEYLKGISVVGEGDDARIEKDDKWYSGKGDTFLPYDHVAVFDEAQRTWTKEEHSRFVREKSKMANFPEWSEARFLISCMDRHPDWAVIVCLIGEGQETGLSQPLIFPAGGYTLRHFFKSMSTARM